VNPPSKFGRFKVIGELGKGAMGIVYKARDPVIDREVAIKTLSAEGREDADLRERFTREARSAGILHHPNIITVYDVGEEKGIPFLALEYLEGRTLQDVIDSDETISLAEKVRIIEQVGSGLHYAHERGVIHRDIKPENVMILEDGTAKITDFGIARSESTDKTKPGVVLGSVGYMAPEQIKGLTLDRRADVFSLGIVAYELLTGQRAFPGDNIPAVMNQILNTNPTPPSAAAREVPGEVDEIIAKALMKDRDDRYATAEEFIESLKSVVGPEEGEAEEEEQKEIRIEEIFGEAEFEEPEEEVPARPMSPATVLFIFLLIVGVGAGLFFGYMKYTDMKEREFQEMMAQELDIALMFFNQGRYEEAIEKYDAILEKDPHNSEAMARRQQAQGRRDRLAQIPPLRDQAAAAVAAGNLPAAIEVYQKILAINPRDPEAVLRIAELKQRIERQQKVGEILSEAQQAFERGEYSDAAALWEQVLELNPANEEARLGMDEVKKRLTGKPELDKLSEEAEKLFQQQEYTRAIALWEQILRVQPEKESLRELIRRARALSALKDQLEAWRRRAQASFDEGNYQEAMNFWGQILHYRPFDAEAREGIQRAKDAQQM
jgi:cytochrome c-type biogenesis protein CcmH/NrfG/tRNA A-37 threonylcarbamoyl transferase component Bud32